MSFMSNEDSLPEPDISAIPHGSWLGSVDVHVDGLLYT